VRFAALLALLALAAAACSSSSNAASGDGGVDAPTTDATYVAPTPCTCSAAGAQLLLYPPPGWCAAGAPQGGTSCGAESCYAVCADATVFDGAFPGPPDAASDAPEEGEPEPADAAGEGASDASTEAAPDAAGDAGAD